jgi:hypothetical protein
MTTCLLTVLSLFASQLCFSKNYDDSGHAAAMLSFLLSLFRSLPKLPPDPEGPGFVGVQLQSSADRRRTPDQWQCESVFSFTSTSRSSRRCSKAPDGEFERNMLNRDIQF